MKEVQGQEDPTPLLAWEIELEEEGFMLTGSSAFRAYRFEDCQAEGHDSCMPGDGHLTIQFHRGKKKPDEPGARWVYEGVSRGTFKGMVEAQRPDSMGQFFAREIKGKAKAWKLESKA